MVKRPIWSETQIMNLVELYEGLEIIIHRGTEQHEVVLTSDPYELKAGDWRVEVEYLNEDMVETLSLSEYNVLFIEGVGWHQVNWLEDINR